MGVRAEVDSPAAGLPREGRLEVTVDGVREPSTAHEHLEIDCSAYQSEVTVVEETGS